MISFRLMFFCEKKKIKIEKLFVASTYQFPNEKLTERSFTDKFLSVSSAGQPRVDYEPSKRSGQQLLVLNGIRHFRNRKRGNKQYWKCSYYYKTKCPSIVIVDEVNDYYELQHEHQHDPALMPNKLVEDFKSE